MIFYTTICANSISKSCVILDPNASTAPEGGFSLTALGNSTYRMIIISTKLLTKFTYEIEEDGKLPFLDALLMRGPEGSIATKVYRKSSNTGLTIDPRSNQDPTAWIGVFKSALCRAYRVCSSESLVKDEIDFLVANFEDNG